MYVEGSTKSFFSFLLAVLIVFSAAFWPQAKFIARFLFDLLCINARQQFQLFLQFLHQHWSFLQ
ncbi:MAG TPA: hypothetical protein VMV05_11950 [bacterium]|nr:hypothetical protein [bacterium]